MAINETVAKIAITAVLNGGTKPTGAINTLNVGLPALNTTGFNAQKAMNIVNSYATNVAAYPLYEVKKVETSTLTEA